MLPSSNISTTLVADTLGSGSNRALSYLCKYPNINYLSLTKPCNKTDAYLSTLQLRIATSMKAVTKQTQVNKFNVKCYVYDIPTVYRLGDFREYNHNSTMRGSADDLTIATTQSSVTYPVKVTLPGMLLTYITGGGDGILRITKGIYGTPDFEEQVGYVDLNALCGNSIDRYVSEISDKTIIIQCTQTKGLPAGGYTNVNNLYISIAQGYIDYPESSYNHFTNKITRNRSYDPSKPEDYGEVNTILVEPANNSTLLYSYITRLVTTDYSYIRVKDLISRMFNMKCIISYKTYSNNNWVTAVTIIDAYTIILGSSIEWLEKPYYNVGDLSYDFVFKHSNGSNNDYITEIMITGHI